MLIQMDNKISKKTKRITLRTSWLLSVEIIEKKSECMHTCSFNFKCNSIASDLSRAQSLIAR